MTALDEKTSGPSKSKEARVICPCTGITEDQLVHSVRRCDGNLETLRRATGIGTHCTGCLPAVVEIFDETLQGPQTLGRRSRSLPVSPKLVVAKMLRRVKRLLVPIRYGLFVIDTPMAKTRVALCNLPLEESAISATPLTFRAELFDRSGKPAKKFSFRIEPGQTRTWDARALLEGTAWAGKPFYGLLLFETRASRVGTTRPYAFWSTDNGITSTHDKYSRSRAPGWNATMVFVEVNADYDTDLILSNPLNRPYRSEVSLVDDAGATLNVGTVALPPHGSDIFCLLNMNRKVGAFLKGRRGCLMLENTRDPIMTYYLGHDLGRNRWTIQHL